MSSPCWNDNSDTCYKNCDVTKTSSPWCKNEFAPEHPPCCLSPTPKSLSSPSQRSRFGSPCIAIKSPRPITLTLLEQLSIESPIQSSPCSPYSSASPRGQHCFRAARKARDKDRQRILSDLPRGFTETNTLQERRSELLFEGCCDPNAENNCSVTDGGIDDGSIWKPITLMPFDASKCRPDEELENSKEFWAKNAIAKRAPQMLLREGEPTLSAKRLSRCRLFLQSYQSFISLELALERQCDVDEVHVIQDPGADQNATRDPA